VEVNESIKLLAEVRMSDGQINGNVFWSSSDDRIAKVNPTTGEVTALSEGRVTVVAAYALETGVKGLAELTIVKDKAQVVSDVEMAPPPELPPPETPPVFADSSGGTISAEDVLVPSTDQTTFSGVAGERRVIGPLFFREGIYEFRITHAGDATGLGIFHTMIYADNNPVGDNFFANIGPFDLTFNYMIYRTGWYYLAVENAGGDWSITRN
jgi:hypothetical protein